MAGLSRRSSANGAGDVQLKEVRFFASDTRSTFSSPPPTAATAAAAARVPYNGQPLTGSPRSSQVHSQTVAPAAGVGLGLVNSGFVQSSVALDKEPEPDTYANSVVFAQRPPRPPSAIARAPALNGGHELPPVNGHERRANDPLASIERSTPDFAPPSEPSRSDSSSNRSQFVSDSTLSARAGHQVLRTRPRKPHES